MVTAALKLIVERGDVGFTVREIATVIGVSHTALYRHFENKKLVLASIAEEGYTELIRRLNAADKIDKVIQAYVDFATTHPGHFRVMYHSELSQKDLSPKLSELAAKSGQLLMQVIAASEKQGQKASKAPIEEVATACWALAHGLSELIICQQLPPKVLNDQAQLSKRIKAVTHLLVTGLFGED